MKKVIFFLTFVFCFTNVFSQDVYTGIIKKVPNPCTTEPCLPGVVFALDVDSTNYILVQDSNWFWDDMIINGIEYFIDDSVIITGIVTQKIDLLSNIYLELEIVSINGTNNNIVIEQNFFNIKQTDENIVISFDELFSGRIQLYDVLGKKHLAKTLLNELNTSICKSTVPKGIYVVVIYSNTFGKIYCKKIIVL